MKTAWNIVAFLAIANLLGVVFLVSWLGVSGRLDSNRIEQARQLFSEPVAVQAARAEEEELQAIAQREAEIEEASLMHLSAGSTVPIDSLEQLSLWEDVVLRALKKAQERHQRVLLDNEQALAAAERGLKEARAAFEKAKLDQVAATQTAGFQSVVKDLESSPPRWAKDYIVLLVNDGREREAAEYLRAMRAGPRTEIFNQMKSEEELQLVPVLHDFLRGTTSTPRLPTEMTNAAPFADASTN